ncbi:MAG TPA: hypothetical protein VJJ78_00275 [Candidatus Saccharimonadales bacterium]|nr:hypothetical protein [Candidatus Saccharimonadales bacterium]
MALEIAGAAEFKEHLFAYPGFLDPEGFHREFSQTPPLHGQKADFDAIPTEDPLFDEWVNITAKGIHGLYSELPSVLISVADGTNRLVGPVAEELGHKIVGLVTKKTKEGIVVLTPETWRKVHGRKPEFALVLEDVASEGNQVASAVRHTKEAGAQRTEALIALKRQRRLKKLVGIAHKSILDFDLPTFTEKDCMTLPEGFCKLGWKLIPYKVE